MTSFERQIRRSRRPRFVQPIAYDPERLDAEEAVRLATRAQGCTCDPDVIFNGISVRVSHDSWCPLLRRGDRN